MTESIPEFLPLYSLKDKKHFKLLLANRNWLIRVDRYYPHQDHRHQYIGYGMLQPIMRVTKKKISLQQFYWQADKTVRRATFHLIKNKEIAKYIFLDLPAVQKCLFFLINIVSILALPNRPISRPAAYIPYLRRGVYCLGMPTEVKFTFRQSVFDYVRTVKDVTHCYTDFARIWENAIDASSDGGTNLPEQGAESQATCSTGN